MLKLDGKLVISKVHSSVSGTYVSLTITDKDSSLLAVKVEIPLEQFSEALFATPSPCKLTFNDSGLVGKVREHKTELVSCSFCDSEEVREKAMEEFEVDGWEGRLSDTKNSHNSRGPNENSKQEVVFERYVDRVK